MKVSLIKTGLAAILASAVLVACGGGGGDQYAPITSNAVTPMTATTAAVLTDNGPIAFAAIPELGIPGVATFTAGGTGPAAYSFNIAEALTGNSASGVLTFGSCIFTVTASTFPAIHPLALGKTATVNPCNLTFQTAGQNTGSSFSALTTLLFGASRSNAFTETVSVAPGGTQVTIQTASGPVTVTVTTLTGGM